MGITKPAAATPRGVKVRRYASGEESLVISFSYRGVECRETLRGMEPTKANIRAAAGIKAEIEKQIAFGTPFQFPHFNRTFSLEIALLSHFEKCD